MKTGFTNITPLPALVSREVAISVLHDRGGAIELNPLVIDRHPIPTPADAPRDEIEDCKWQEMVDRIPYAAGLVRSKVKYRGRFFNLSNGLQTHVHAPLNLSFREKWTVEGTLPGEPDQPQELGLSDVPRRGLYLREDAEIKCNVLMTNFVRNNLDSAHKVLVERILVKAERIQRHLDRRTPGTISYTSASRTASHDMQTDIICPVVDAASWGSSSSTPVNAMSNKPRPKEPLDLDDGDDLESAIRPALREEYRRSVARNRAATDSILPAWHSLSH